MVSSLNVGDKAPEFAVEDTQGRSLELTTLLSEGPVVLIFFPKAFTPG